MTAFPACHEVDPPGRRTPYTPTAATASAAISTLATSEPPIRRNGETAGSASRMASAPTTRCSVNCWECS